MKSVDLFQVTSPKLIVIISNRDSGPVLSVLYTPLGLGTRKERTTVPEVYQGIEKNR